MTERNEQNQSPADVLGKVQNLLNSGTLTPEQKTELESVLNTLGTTAEKIRYERDFQAPAGPDEELKQTLAESADTLREAVPRDSEFAGQTLAVPGTVVNVRIEGEQVFISTPESEQKSPEFMKLVEEGQKYIDRSLPITIKLLKNHTQCEGYKEFPNIKRFESLQSRILDFLNEVNWSIHLNSGNNPQDFQAHKITPNTLVAELNLWKESLSNVKAPNHVIDKNSSPEKNLQHIVNSLQSFHNWMIELYHKSKDSILLLAKTKEDTMTEEDQIAASEFLKKPAEQIQGKRLQREYFPDDPENHNHPVFMVEDKELWETIRALGESGEKNLDFNIEPIKLYRYMNRISSVENLSLTMEDLNPGFGDIKITVTVLGSNGVNFQKQIYALGNTENEVATTEYWKDMSKNTNNYEYETYITDIEKLIRPYLDKILNVNKIMQILEKSAL